MLYLLEGLLGQETPLLLEDLKDPKKQTKRSILVFLLEDGKATFILRHFAEQKWTEFSWGWGFFVLFLVFLSKAESSVRVCKLKRSQCVSASCNTETIHPLYFLLLFVAGRGQKSNPDGSQ